MDTNENDRDEAGKPGLTIGGNVSGQVGMGSNVIQIGSISGGVVTLNPSGTWGSPAGQTPSGPSLPPDLYARLRNTLLDCGPFDDEKNLATLFVTEGLSQWRYDIPEADSAGERADRVIAWLWPKAASGENGLIILLRALAGRYEDPAGCRRQLEILANELTEQLTSEG